MVSGKSNAIFPVNATADLNPAITLFVLHPKKDNDKKESL